MPTDPHDPRLAASVELVGRSGSDSFELRYSDDQEPVVWMAIGKWGEKFEVGASVDPLRACIRLLETVIDGGICNHCKRPSGVSDDWTQSMPLEEHVCWYVYDPEKQTFRRGCEGD